MTVGNVCLWLATAGYGLAVGGFFRLAQIRKQGGAELFVYRLARFGWALGAAALVGAAADLLHLIFTHRFDIDYVYNYTSTDLPWFYLASAFWAGQEGTLLLWALIGAGLGLGLALQARSWEPPTMAGLGLVQLYLLALLLIQSPFAANPKGALIEGFGLNPLLQNPWMVAHPPLLFVGYAALALPFVFAVASLLRREYEEWVVQALPWTLFAWVALGIGILLGAYWAYETLGWGGYWGWDPVENASLVPWLLATALLHGMVLQKATGALRRTNLALAILSFVAVTYGSYLTRSGVLGEFSVHSFATLSAGFNAFLIGFIGLPLLLGGGLLAWRWRSISSPPPYTSLSSRSFAVVLGIVLLGISAGLVTLGMSAPILTGLLLRKAASVSPAFYNRTHAPLAALLAALLCVGGPLAWREGSGRRVWEGIRGPLWIALPGTIGAAVAVGTFHLHRSERTLGSVAALAVAQGAGRSFHWILFGGILGVALGVNVVLTWRLIRRRLWYHSGAHLAHIGLVTMLIGIIASSAFESKQRITLAAGRPQALFGYLFHYSGTRQRADGKTEVLLEVGKGEPRKTASAPTWSARPLMFMSQQGLIRTPAIRRGIIHDLYVEPEETTEARSSTKFRLKKGETAQMGDYKVRFLRFDIPEHGMGQEDFMVGAVLEVIHAGKTEKVVPTYGLRNGRLHGEPAVVGQGPVKVQINGMEAGSGVISLRWKGLPEPVEQPATAVVVVTLKPLMSVLWLGCLILVVGGGVAFYRRLREAGHAPDGGNRGGPWEGPAD